MGFAGDVDDGDDRSVESSTPDSTRRALLGGLASSGLLLAGCSGDSPDEGDAEPTADDGPSAGSGGESTPESTVTDDGGSDADGTATFTGASQHKYDARNSGSAGNQSAPRSAPTEEWTFGTETPVTTSLAVDDGRVLFGTDGGSMYAVSAGSGDELWSFETDGAVKATPAVGDGTVYAGGGRGLYALDAAEGTEQWSVEFTEPVTGITVTGDALYVATEYHNRKANPTLHRYDLSDEEVWSIVESTPLESPPTVVDGMVLTAPSGEFLRSVAATDPADGSNLWETAERYWGTPIADEAQVYVAGTAITALDFDGERLWVYETDTNPEVPTVGADAVYTSGTDKAYAIGKSDGELSWEYPYQADFGRAPVSPTIAGDVAIFGFDDEDAQSRESLLALDVADGSKLWGATVGTLADSPVVAGGRIFVPIANGSVVALA